MQPIKKEEIIVPSMEAPPLIREKAEKYTLRSSSELEAMRIFSVPMLNPDRGKVLKDRYTGTIQMAFCSVEKYSRMARKA